MQQGTPSAIAELHRRCDAALTESLRLVRESSDVRGLAESAGACEHLLRSVRAALGGLSSPPALAVAAPPGQLSPSVRRRSASLISVQMPGSGLSSQQKSPKAPDGTETSADAPAGHQSPWHATAVTLHDLDRARSGSVGASGTPPGLRRAVRMDLAPSEAPDAPALQPLSSSSTRSPLAVSLGVAPGAGYQLPPKSPTGAMRTPRSPQVGPAYAGSGSPGSSAQQLGRAFKPPSGIDLLAPDYNTRAGACTGTSHSTDSRPPTAAGWAAAAPPYSTSSETADATPTGDVTQRNRGISTPGGHGQSSPQS
eukprot:m51a1_g12245 hypothetical protein (310) ;mRNA; r:135100-136080